MKKLSKAQKAVIAHLKQGGVVYSDQTSYLWGGEAFLMIRWSTLDVLVRLELVARSKVWHVTRSYYELTAAGKEMKL